MSHSLIAWTAGTMALAVSAAELVRMRTATGAARSATGLEALMAGCMAVMFLPVTAAWISGRQIWVGLFTVLGLVSATAGARGTIAGGWRRGGHWFHHAVGCGAMAWMAADMTSGATHPGMRGMPGMADTHGTTLEGAACAVLAVYFLLSMATVLRAQLLAVEVRVGLPALAAVPVGRIAMGGIMAVMLLLMV